MKIEIENASAHPADAEVLLKEYAEAFPADRRDVSPESGTMLIAYADDGMLAGCVALLEKDDALCELVRLYVRPMYRGERIGKKLVREILQLAKDRAFDAVHLFAVRPGMMEAMILFQGFGFVETSDAPGEETLPGAVCMRYKL